MSDNRYVVGKAFPLDSLRTTKRTRQPSPRDEALTKAIRAAAATAESQAIPFTFPDTDKPGTVKAAAKRIVAELQVPVNVGLHRSHPHTVLLSRGLLSNKGTRRPA